MTEPLPVPTGLRIEIQGTLAHATQLQVPDVTVTGAVPGEPAGPVLTLAAIVNAHPGWIGCAITTPWPVSRSTPAASMSIADARSASLICACVKPGLCDLISAAIAAAAGAAADVP